MRRLSCTRGHNRADRIAMAVIVVAVLLVSLGIANTVSGASLTSRQTPDPCMDQLQAVQPQCIQALVTLSQIGNLTQPGNDPDRLRAVFEPPLMVFCASDCLGPVLDLVQCQVRDENATNFVSTLVRLICSNDGGTYCLLKVLSDLVNFSQLDCGRTGTCNSTCQAAHEQVRDDFGCCAATWFQQGSFFAFLGTTFTNCRVPLGEQCPLPSSAIRVLTLHITMLLIVSVLAGLLA